MSTSSNPWRRGKASSFADPADVRAFKRAKERGLSDREAFKYGDNGIGLWGTDTTLPRPMCALPREDWEHLGRRAEGAPLEVRANGRQIRCELQDTLPSRRFIKNGVVIDLNPEACRLLGMTPPILVTASWRWATPQTPTDSKIASADSPLARLIAKIKSALEKLGLSQSA